MSSEIYIDGKPNYKFYFLDSDVPNKVRVNYSCDGEHSLRVRIVVVYFTKRNNHLIQITEMHVRQIDGTACEDGRTKGEDYIDLKEITDRKNVIVKVIAALDNHKFTAEELSWRFNEDDDP